MAGIIQLIGRKSCRETRKAERFFKERRIQVQFVDLDDRDLSPGEWQAIFRNLSPEDLIDRDSRLFKEKLAFLDFSAEEELVAQPKLLKTPVLRFQAQSFQGCDERNLAEIVALAK